MGCMDGGKGKGWLVLLVPSSRRKDISFLPSKSGKKKPKEQEGGTTVIKR